MEAAAVQAVTVCCVHVFIFLVKTNFVSVPFLYLGTFSFYSYFVCVMDTSTA